MAKKTRKPSRIGDISAVQKEIDGKRGVEYKWVPHIEIIGKPVALSDRETPSGFVECDTQEQALEIARRLQVRLTS